MQDQSKDKDMDRCTSGNPFSSQWSSENEIDKSLDNRAARPDPETDMDSNSAVINAQFPVEYEFSGGPSNDAINIDILRDRHRPILQGLNNVPKFTDAWSRSKEDEVEARNMMETQDETSLETTDEYANTNSIESMPDSSDCLLSFPNFQDLDTIKEKTNGGTFAKPTEANPCSAVASVNHNDEAKTKLKPFDLEQMPPDPSPDPGLEDSNDIASVDHNEAAKQKLKRSQLEHMPPDPAPVPGIDSDGMASAGYNNTNKSKLKGFLLEQIPPDPSPGPVTDGGGNTITAKKKLATHASSSAERDTSPVTQRTNLHSQLDPSRETENLRLIAREVEFIDEGQANEPARTETSTEFNLDIEAQSHTAVSSLGNTDIAPTTLLEHDASFSLIPEAFLVEEEGDKVFAVAELIPPWWKRKRTYAVLFFVALLVIATALGISISQRNSSGNTNEAIFLIANETTTAPSISLAPSSSHSPSSRPSACVEQQSVNARELDFTFFNLTNPVCAIDGEHAVVVDIHLEGGISYLYVIFYGLTKYGNWDRMYHFVEHLSSGNDTDLASYVYWDDTAWDDTYSVAMSRNTVTVGVPFIANGTGSVFVYEYSEQIKEWKNVFGSIAPDDGGRLGRRFGHSLDIDDDLAIVYAPGDETIFVFRREGSVWKQTTTFGAPANTSQVVLSGNTIAATVSDFLVHLFQYDQTSETVTSPQDPLELQLNSFVPYVGRLALSGSHLAVAAFYNNMAHEIYYNGCWNPYRAVGLTTLYDVLLYHRPNSSKPFEMLQLLNSSEFDQGFGPNIALYEDILLIGGAGNKSNIFIYNNGYWEESLVLDKPNECGSDGYGDRVHISKRNAMVSTWNNVYMYNVDSCVPMPTSVPSSSPSLNPSITCYWIEISIEHYHANEPTWNIERLNENEISINTESSTIIPTLRPTFQAFAVVGYDPFHLTYVVEKKCLQEGIYEFTIFNEPLQYNLTSYGQIIAQGNGSRYKESAVFEIPIR